MTWSVASGSIQLNRMAFVKTLYTFFAISPCSQKDMVAMRRQLNLSSYQK